MTELNSIRLKIWSINKLNINKMLNTKMDFWRIKRKRNEKISSHCKFLIFANKGSKTINQL